AEGQVPTEVMERITAQPWYFSVTGRLDKDSRGLLIMTQDGVLAKQITNGHRFTKHYEVQLSEAVKSTQIEQLRAIRHLDDKVLKPMTVTRMGDKALRFQLIEGRKHQIRRSCQQVGLHVTDLLRTQIGPVKIGKLTTGHWRLASDAEISELKNPQKQGKASRPQSSRGNNSDRGNNGGKGHANGKGSRRRR
ncbi:MAG: rRNA pseudouridine synthase, partial [Sphaerospermopsis sp. SIO1G2]|nr:rRNA pseudouridine synthase [Sphaerospermopsis sp. SIO1G2]